jgi:hypothetical protein
MEADFNSASESHVSEKNASGRTTGICLSGGGVRSAAFSLGAIQCLQLRLGLLKGPKAATYLSAVSGGSYTAAAFCAVAGGVLDTPSIWIGHPKQGTRREGSTPDGHPVLVPKGSNSAQRAMRKVVARRTKEMEEDGWATVSPLDPMMPGTPEAAYLRAHARYLLEPGGWPGAAAAFLSRIFVHVIGVAFLIASFGFVANLAGTGLRSLFELISSARLVGYLTFLIGFAPSLLVFALIFFATHKQRKGERAFTTTRREAAFIDAVYVVTVVTLLSVLVWAAEAVGPDLFRLGGPGPSWAERAWQGAVATLTAGALAGALSVLAKASVVNFVDPGARLRARAGRLAVTGLIRVMQALLALSFPLIMFFCYKAGWDLAGLGGLTDRPWLLAGALAGLISADFILIALIYPYLALHVPYRRRLASGFDVVRQARVVHDRPVSDERDAQSGAGQQGAWRREERAYKRIVGPKLSKLREVCDIPELLICASVNVSETGIAPAGSRVLPIIFSPNKITMPNVAGCEVDTNTYEEVCLGKDSDGTPSLFDYTLMAYTALTSAAVSPAMGKFSRHWLRGPLAFFNLRLGYWLPNPASPDVQEVLRTRSDPGWIRGAPGPLTALRDFRGRHYFRTREIFVSDGGHYENLGLVELVRRQCDDIWCVDASADGATPGAALAESFSLIGSELGYLVQGDLSRFRSKDPNEPRNRSHHEVCAQFTVVDPRRADRLVSTLNVIKLGVHASTPPDVAGMRSRYPKFPFDPTMDQIYNAQRFDLYRSLGFASTDRAISRFAS